MNSSESPSNDHQSKPPQPQKPGEPNKPLRRAPLDAAKPKPTEKEISSQFQKNLNSLFQSKNHKRRKKEYRRNKLGEMVEFSAKYSSKGD